MDSQLGHSANSRPFVTGAEQAPATDAQFLPTGVSESEVLQAARFADRHSPNRSEPRRHDNLVRHPSAVLRNLETFLGGALRACEGSRSQVAKSNSIGSIDRVRVAEASTLYSGFGRPRATPRATLH
jgi:hypothetical protein